MYKSIIVFGLSLFLLAACTNKQKSDSNLKGKVRIDGSSTVFPITEAVAEEFRFVEKDILVTVGESGTGGGFKKFSRGEIDIIDASRTIKPEEVKACNEAGIEYLELEIAYDGLAVMINPENNWVDYLTTEELKKIWEPEAQGNIVRWSQIRAGWPDEEIHLYGPGTASGTYDYFTEVICGKAGASRGDYTASENDNVLVQGLAGDKGGLAYFGIAYYEANKDKLKLVPINNGTGAVLPSKETVLNKQYSPLSRPLYIYVNKEALSQPHIIAFLNFYMDNAGDLANEVGYITLEKKLYESMKAKLKEVDKMESAH
ncbi:MAG: PstS family phosphate ABC transporter substrate-binding protein [Chitinophagales bacterium]|nr:PstS family phosphate ABC transporter substrate-binding protein [Chitinophagales bacterium]